MNEEHKLLEYLYRKLGEEREEIVAGLARGTAVDYAHYREACGRIYGLAMAQGIVNEMSDKLRKQDGD